MRCQYCQDFIVIPLNTPINTIAINHLISRRRIDYLLNVIFGEALIITPLTTWLTAANHRHPRLPGIKRQINPWIFFAFKFTALDKIDMTNMVNYVIIGKEVTLLRKFSNYGRITLQIRFEFCLPRNKSTNQTTQQRRKPLQKRASQP